MLAVLLSPLSPHAPVCHGVLALSRPGLLANALTTTVPAFMESQAYVLTRFLSQMGVYQLSTTWPRYTQEEVEPSAGAFLRGPLDLLAPLVPGSATSHAHAFGAALRQLSLLCVAAICRCCCCCCCCPVVVVLLLQSFTLQR